MKIKTDLQVVAADGIERAVAKDLVQPDEDLDEILSEESNGHKDDKDHTTNL